MTNTTKEPTLIVLELVGGNDFLNTLIPYTNGLYYDSRPHIAFKPEDVLPINDTLGFNKNATTLQQFYNSGKMSIVQGVGYPNSSRSHFRSRDIWHTCEPDKVATEGWLGKVIRDLDPKKENVLTAISISRGLPRAVVAQDVPVTSIGDLDTYGLLTGIKKDDKRAQAMSIFEKMYSPYMGTGAVRDYLKQTGRDVQAGAEILKTVPGLYKSSVEYADSAIAQNLRDVARIHLADLGVKVFYVQHGGYDTHANEYSGHEKLMIDLNRSIKDFFADLEEHNATENVIMMIWSEFGRRVVDNGSGTDHGAGGGAFLIGDRVNGGLYSEYPSIEPNKTDNGDLAFQYDFRGFYSSVIDQWFHLDSASIVGGQFEQIPILN